MASLKTLHRGRIATDPTILAIRPLTRDDLACLRDKRPTQGICKVFRDNHHRVARLCAAGLPPSEVAARSGLTTTRVSQLRGDPAFEELVTGYREKVTEAFVESAEAFYEVATSNMLKAEVMLSDKIDAAIDSGEHLPTKDLLAISRDAADRFGFPKQKVSQNTNLNVDFATMLEKAAARSGRSNVIDASASSRLVSGPQGTSRPLSLPAAQPKPSPGVAGIRRRA